jgi:transposase
MPLTNKGGIVMYSVGVDIAKEKSVAAILTEYGEIVAAPKTYEHTRQALLELSNNIRSLGGEVRIVLEATGAYHFPVVTFLQEQGFFVSVVNPLIIKKYAAINLRKVKTDAADALKIASYGVDNWRHLTTIFRQKKYTKKCVCLTASICIT